mgnify:CR=1 FL=1
MSKNNLTRRGLLRAGGVVLALPAMTSLAPRALATTLIEQPRRMVNICTTLGLYADSWFPKTAGADYEPSEYLSHINHHRDRFTLFSGLAHKNQNGRQAHNSEITWLTSAEHPGLDGFQNTISLDQVAANHLGYVTRFPSVTLGSLTPQSQSYTSSGVMVPAETSPSAMFANLFLQGDAEAVRKEKQNLASGGSILDQLRQEASALRRTVSDVDRKKLDAYFDAVRTAEAELVEISAWQQRPKPVVDGETPVDFEDPAELIGRVRLMLGLIPLILQTDSSRVVSLMIQDHAIVPNVTGVSGDHHGLSHHGQDEEKISQLRLVENQIVGQFAAFLDRLAESAESGESLLDTTTVLFGSNMGNANSHASVDLPILVAGGDYKHGQHIVHEGTNRPLSDLYLTLLHGMGVSDERFGHSEQALTWS